MVTIGGVSSAGAASTYFAKDNYYTTAQGLGESEWFGKGAEELGLIDPVLLDVETVDDGDEPAAAKESPDNKDQTSILSEGRDTSENEASVDIETVDAEGTGSNANSIDNEAEPEIDPDAANKEGVDLQQLEQVDIGEDNNVGEPKNRVDAKDFKAVLEGRTGDGQRIGYEDKDGNWRHNPGKDMVFSPSKSVSVMALVGGDKRLISEFQESVKETLQFAERNYASVQDNPKKGEKAAFKTGNLTVGLFTHDTSRNQDPLLHVHAVIGNMTKDPRTDKWRALNKRALYKNVYTLSRIQRANFAERVKAIGYDIEFGQHGNFELTAVPQSVRDEFSSRRAEIIEKLDGKDATFNERRNATLSTRAAKKELPRSQLTSSWKDRSEAKGFIASDNIPEERSVGRAISTPIAVAEAIEHTTYNQTTTTRGQIVAFALQHRKSGNNIASIESYIDQAEKNGDLLVHSNHQNTAETHYTTKEEVAAERRIQEIYKNGQNKKPITADRPSLRINLGRTHHVNGRDIKLNDTQRGAMLHVLTSRDKYIGIQGLAGVGKTTALGVAIKSLKETNRFNPFTATPKIIGMAPTIAASKELAEKTNGSEVTVQKYVKSHKYLLDRKRRPSKASLNKYRGSVILHDESSMLSNQMQKDFMEINEILGIAKVVFVGDTGQHGSVQSGPAFKMLQSFGMKTATMDEIIRQKNEPLLAAANAFSNHEFHKGFGIIADNIHSGEDFIADASKLFVDDREAGKNTILITMDNKTRKAVNAAVRSELKQRGTIGNENFDQDVLLPTYLTQVQAAYSSNYARGDILEFSKDIYNREIKAGEQWKVDFVNHKDNNIVLKSGDQKEIWKLTKLDEQPFEHLREDTLKLSKDDEVKFKQDNDLHEVRREQAGKVIEISETSMTIKLDGSRELVLPRDDKLAARIDHTYANTTYNVQGKTAAHSIGVIDPHSRAVNGEAMSVMGTRSEHSLDIFTSNQQQMRTQIESNDESDKIATHAISLDSSERVQATRENIQQKQDTARDTIRENIPTRGGVER